MCERDIRALSRFFLLTISWLVPLFLFFLFGSSSLIVPCSVGFRHFRLRSLLPSLLSSWFAVFLLLFLFSQFHLCVPKVNKTAEEVRGGECGEVNGSNTRRETAKKDKKKKRKLPLC